MYFDNNGRSQGKFQQMTDEWIEENFDKEDLKLVKEHAIKVIQKFLRIPVGDIIDVKPTMMISQNPKVKYQQEANPVCAYAALASTLHYLKHEAEAKLTMEFFYASRNDTNFYNTTCTLQYIINEVQSHSNYRMLRKKYNIIKLSNTYNILDTTIIKTFEFILI